MLDEVRIRDELAGMNDHTVLPEELAAIYLGISLAELVALRAPGSPQPRGRVRVWRRGPD